MGYLINSGTGFLKDAVTTVSNVKSYLVNKTGYLVDAIRVGIGDFGQRVLDDGGTVEASAEAAASYREITKEIYDQASLVLFPSGYKDNLVYSHKPVNGSADFTYTRGTDTATRVGADGYIKKERANLLVQSNQFDTTWNLSGGSTLNQNAVGIDNIPNTAWTFTKDSTFDGIKQNISLSGINTFSVYAKKIDSSVNELVLRINVAGGNRVAIFDLSNGTKVSMTSDSSAVHYDIQKAGNGWYRCSFVVSGTIANVDIRMDYNQTGTGSILVQNAQLEQGLVPTSYIETTTAPVYEGLTDNLPRIDYTGGIPSILLEPSRTNLMTYSEIFEGSGSGYWRVFDNGTIEPNYGISPEGVQNSTKIGTSGGGNDFVYNSITISSGTTYTLSCFVKNIDATESLIYGINTADNDLTWSGSTLTNVVGGDFEPLDNGWYRISITTTSTSTTAITRIYSDRNGGTGSIEIYGFQVEEGSYPTSYIPTYNASATRAADYFDIGVLSSDILPDSTDWTIYIEAENVKGSQRLIDGNNTIDVYTTLFNGLRFYWRADASYLSTTSGSKIIARLSSGVGTDFQDGTQTGTGAITGDYSGMRLDMDNKDASCVIKKMLIFPTALSDDDCEALTAL